MSNLISTPSMAMGQLPMADSAISTLNSNSQMTQACHMHHSMDTQQHGSQAMHSDTAAQVSGDCDDASSQLCKIQCELSACSAMLLGLSSDLSLPILDNDTPVFSYSRVFPKQQQESLYRPPLIG